MGAAYLCYTLALSNLFYRVLDGRPGEVADDATITPVQAWLPPVLTKENSIYNAARCRGWALVTHCKGGVEILRAIIDQYIHTNTTATLTQYSCCIAQLISLLGQVAKDECALVAQDLIEVRNSLRQPGK